MPAPGGQSRTISGRPRTPRPGRLLGSATGTLAAPPAETWRALLSVLPEVAGLDAELIAKLGAPRTFIVPLGDPPVSKTSVEVDPVDLQVSQAGQWWYCGVVKVTAHESGSAVTRFVFNIAPGLSTWLVPLVHRHDQAALELAHDALLRAIREQLARAGAP